MQFQTPFDAHSVEPSSFDTIPPGDYQVVIVADQQKLTRDEQGGLLEITLQIIQGQFQGKTFRWNLNLYNKSEQAMAIAYKQLSAICHVTNVFNVQDSRQLHNIPFIATVAINQAGYNDVKGVKDMQGNSPGKPKQQQPAAPGTPPPFAAPGAPPVAAAPAWAPPGAPPAAAPPFAPPPAAAPSWPPVAAPAASAWPGAPGAPPANAAPPAAPAWTPPGAPPAAPAWTPTVAAPAPPWGAR